MVIGAPQSEQNVRSATSDSFKILRLAEWVNLMAAFETSMKGRNPEPDNCWHARQWQRVRSDGVALDVY